MSNKPFELEPSEIEAIHRENQPSHEHREFMREHNEQMAIENQKRKEEDQMREDPLRCPNCLKWAWGDANDGEPIKDMCDCNPKTTVTYEDLVD